jgi:hypothetical protein
MWRVIFSVDMRRVGGVCVPLCHTLFTGRREASPVACDGSASAVVG